MTDDLFTKPSQVSGGNFWKPAEHEGQVHVFINGTRQDGPNAFGNDYALCDWIWVPEATAFYQANYAEVSQAILLPRVTAAPIMVGVVEKVKTDKGREAWGLSDADDQTMESVRVAFLKTFEQVDGRWVFKDGDPQEAPF